MKMQVCFLLVVVGLASVASGEDPGHVYCGRMLAQKLAMLCYSEDNMVKRSAYGLGSQYGAGDDYSWWVAPAQARELRTRNKRQVVSECCDKPCTVSELLSYC